MINLERITDDFGQLKLVQHLDDSWTAYMLHRMVVYILCSLMYVCLYVLNCAQRVVLFTRTKIRITPLQIAFPPKLMLLMLLFM